MIAAIISSGEISASNVSSSMISFPFSSCAEYFTVGTYPASGVIEKEKSVPYLTNESMELELP